MAFYLQLRRLRQEVQKQLNELNDPENHQHHGTETPSSQRSPSVSDKEEDEKEKEREASPAPEDSSRDRCASMPGIEPYIDEDGSKHYIVSWSSAEDPNIPHNWSHAHLLKVTVLLFLIA